MKNSNLGLSYFSLAVLAAFTILLNSCSGGKNLNYFQDVSEDAVVTLPPIKMEQRVIQVGDQLQIQFAGRDPEAAAPFNSMGAVSIPLPATAGITVGGGGAGNANPQNQGFLVNNMGMIELPILGKMMVTGITQERLKDTLTRMVAPYLRDPIVNVRFINYNFTVIGEVRSPGGYALPLEKTTIFDALAAAGDLTPIGKRQNIKIYRDYNGKRTISTFDITKKDFLTNPNIFQIRHNDVLYVQVARARPLFEDLRIFTGIAALGIGVLNIILTLNN